MLHLLLIIKTNNGLLLLLKIMKRVSGMEKMKRKRKVLLAINSMTSRQETLMNRDKLRITVSSAIKLIR